MQNLVRKARLVQHDESNNWRYRQALDVLQLARGEVEAICDETREILAEHDLKGESLKLNTLTSSGSGSLVNRKGKGREIGADDELLDGEHGVGLPKTIAGEEHLRKRSGFQARLREYTLLAHQIRFLLGDVYHILGPNYSAQEDESYVAAETLRKQLLKSAIFHS